MMTGLVVQRARAVLVLLVLGLLAWAAGRDFLAQREVEPLTPAALCETRRLSDWLPALRGGRGDSPVYRFRGARPGGRVLVLGGVHPNEPAGFLAAVLLVENLRVQAGEIWVLPRANASAFTTTDPQEGTPQQIVLKDRAGRPRAFRVGSRVSSPLDQWPDPEITVHRPSGQALSGIEVRNLNRCFPGRPDGTFTEGVACAIRRLVERERIDLLVDLHEAAIEYPVVNAVVAHERAGDLAAEAVFTLSMEGLDFALEPSPPRLHGLSHRELGDGVPGLYATLMESANPAQGRLRERSDAAQILAGRDPCYLAAQGIPGLNKVAVDSTGLPLTLRVGRHLEGLRALILALGSSNPARAVAYEGPPTLAELQADGFSPWLSPQKPGE